MLVTSNHGNDFSNLDFASFFEDPQNSYIDGATVFAYVADIRYGLQRNLFGESHISHDVNCLIIKQKQNSNWRHYKFLHETILS